MRAKTKFLMFGLLFITAIVFMAVPTKAASVTPVFVAGNPTCVGLGYDYGFKVDPPSAGTYDIDGTNTVTVTTDGVYFSWSSTLAMDAVISKGGPNANVYAYNPEALSDTNLNSPINPNNGRPFGLSHIEFCFDYELQVSKTANTTFTREWDWNIEKDCEVTELTLQPNQTIDVDCEVDLTATSSDGAWGVNGQITVFNPAPVSATITGVTDVISGFGMADVDCNVSFPYVLTAGSSLVCDYESLLPDATERVNTATATTSGSVEGGSGQAAVVFGNPTTVTDECITVDDDQYGPLGTFCADALPITVSYVQQVSAGSFEECGENEFINTATFTTNDSGTTGNSSHTIVVDIPCATGCTLTQGYWKTHSSYGPAPYDETWAQIGENTVFFNSGKTWYQAFWTAPAGNAYYNLAHQYMAASLNAEAGATVPANVQTAMNSATALFNTYTPAQIAALKGNSTVRAQFITLAGILGSYNEGLIGPGHCDE